MNSSHIFEAIRCAISSFVLIHHKEWHSRKKKPASNRDLSEYNTCENSLERFWAEVMNTIAHLINKFPQLKLIFISCYGKLWNLKPTVSHFLCIKLCMICVRAKPLGKKI